MSNRFEKLERILCEATGLGVEELRLRRDLHMMQGGTAESFMAELEELAERQGNKLEGFPLGGVN